MCNEITKSEYQLLKLLYATETLPTAKLNEYTSKHPESIYSYRILRKNGYIEMVPDIKNHIVIGTKDEIRITDKGRKAYIIYKEEHRMFNKQIIFNQIAIPIIVTILTNTLIHAIQWLLPLIQQSLSSFLN